MFEKNLFFNFFLSFLIKKIYKYNLFILILINFDKNLLFLDLFMKYHFQQFEYPFISYLLVNLNLDLLNFILNLVSKSH
jgi:hypothetical protein